MTVLLLAEWDNPKDETRLKKVNEWESTFMQRKIEEGIVKKVSQWTDGSGHIYWIAEFDDIDAYAKVWGEEEFHVKMIRWNRLVDNMSIRLLRPTMSVPLE